MPRTNCTISTIRRKSSFSDIPNKRFKSGWFIEWPEGISYLTWQNILKCFLWFLGKSNNSRGFKPKKKTKPSRRYRKFLKKKIERKKEVVEKQITSIINKLATSEPSKNDGSNVKIELITMLKKFLETKHVNKHIEETIPASSHKV